jgi:CubicO group peptidase (beta-lactamase class C family)
VLLKGYGLRDVQKRLPMTENTVQPIASITKSFTVASLATLVRDGKLNWDTPVRDYLPDFRLHNDYATQNLTVRDLVTHRSGLPRHDWAWYGSTATREELYKRLRYFEFSADLRQRFQYNNFMYMTAGYLGGKVAGSDWESLVRSNVFVPLAMNTASFTVADMLKQPDHGTGYALDDHDQPQPKPYQELVAMGPTGSINASARDMANYLLMYTQGGQFSGKTVIAASDLREMTSPQFVLPDSRLWPERTAPQYGMGFFLEHYRGIPIVHHGGNLEGLSSILMFVPGRNVGIYAAVNVSGSYLRDVLMYSALDRLLGLAPIDWSTRYKELRDKNKAAEKSAKAQNLTPRKSGTQPAHPLDEYIGEYFNEGYGTLTISRGDGKGGNALTLGYNGFSTPLKHFHYEVFEAPENELNELERSKVQFVTDMEGEVSSLRTDFEPAVKPIEFKRLPDRALRDPKVIAPFAGTYEIGPIKLVVTLRADNVLTLSVPGQPVRELEGVRGRRFNIKGLNGYSVEFVASAGGEISQMALYQPGSNRVATRVKQ